MERSAQFELARLNEQFQRLFQNSGTIICIVDEDGRYQMINDKAAAGLGKSPDEVVGKSLFDFLDRETAETYLERNRQLLRTGGRREYEDTFDLPTGRRSF
jgi:PAS domain S-box-containing protein